MTKFVSVEEARAARGLRLVLAGNIPSPWSEAAKGAFDVKGINYVGVRQRIGEAESRVWTGHPNAPVAMFDDEPPLTNWGDILALAERLGPEPSLIPVDEDDRIAMFGLSHELLGQGGLNWSARLLMIHDGLTTGGARGFPLRAAAYLAPKYGYAPDRIAAARKRIAAVVGALAACLSGGSDYLLGDRLSATDIHAAVTLGILLPLPEELCPTLPVFRHACETLDDDIRALVPATLRAHRDRLYERHLSLPVTC
ncbi:MAG TPA: glutathione S-transferase C-terminal domain-containing protein [Burkholderiaceae bacterium]|jgi:glutathione S-transferase|nr:glutathione S-transferase C-terminal domain-containing protein [Burkholderiaceae bacterium]